MPCSKRAQQAGPESTRQNFSADCEGLHLPTAVLPFGQLTLQVISVAFLDFGFALVRRTLDVVAERH